MAPGSKHMKHIRHIGSGGSRGALALPPPEGLSKYEYVHDGFANMLSLIYSESDLA